MEIEIERLQNELKQLKTINSSIENELRETKEILEQNIKEKETTKEELQAALSNFEEVNQELASLKTQMENDDINTNQSQNTSHSDIEAINDKNQDFQISTSNITDSSTDDESHTNLSLEEVKNYIKELKQYTYDNHDQTEEGEKRKEALNY